MFRVGDKVVCVVNGQWRHFDGPMAGLPTIGPSYHEELIIDYMDSDGWLGFDKYKNDESDTWDPTAFIKTFGSQVASEIESEMHQLDELIERRLEEIEQLKYKI